MTAANLIVAILLATRSLLPLWQEIMGQVLCPNALFEHHVITENCETTVCVFPQDVYTFSKCGDGELRCQAYSYKKKKKVDCIQPQETF